MKIGRRDFLGICATAATMAALPEKADASGHFEGHPDSYGMLVDTTQCIGSNCRRCEQACKESNELNLEELNLLDNSVFDKPRRTNNENFTVVNKFPNPDIPNGSIFVKKQCMHCAEPACASACFVKAFTKTPEGPVIYNKDVCVGCRYCMVACPFNIPAYDFYDAFSPEVKKCNMCYDRIKEGKKPACASICPKECITFGKRSDLIKLAREKIRNHPERYKDEIYGEHEVGGTSWLYLASTDFDNIGFNTKLGTTPIGEYTRGPLGLVPVVLTTWPLILAGLTKAASSRNEEKENDHQQTEQGGH